MKNRVSFQSHIPNLITSINLFFGCISIVLVFQDRLILASLFIFAAGIMDFLDGVAARLLHTYSELGKMLDSLADMVSFGLAPSVILYKLLSISVWGPATGVPVEMLGWKASFIPYTAFIIAVFSALRLAKFNIDTRQTESFIGVPTPAIAFLCASLPFVLKDYEMTRDLILTPWALIPFILISSFLLVSEIPIISLKFKNLRLSENKSRFILLFSSLVLVIFLRISAFPFIFIIYFLISVINNPQRRKG
jgi:CDP-diacylglycerol---serine O-phosphatidyltransferase